MLEIKDTHSSKRQQAKKRQQLIAPFHEGDVGARLFGCQRKNRLSAFAFVGKVRDVWVVR